MSIEIIKSQIDKFLSSETPEVMEIKGKWGVGKTYSWNKFLLDAKNNNRIKLKKYSYVSLFGINSLDAFKYAIFENVVDHKLIGTEANIETFKNNSVSVSTLLGKKGLDLIKSKSTTHAIESLAFLSLSNVIICIDDLERKGKNLDIKDVLGLVSLLKEQKKCKVVLLLNDGEDGLEDYVKYREKVIDFEMEFSLTAAESAEIAFDGAELIPYAVEVLKESSVKLNIRNIRVLKKIERLIKLVIPYLDGYEQEIIYQVVHSLTLFSWCYYCEQSDDAPPLNFVINLEYSLFGISIEAEDTDEHKKWKSIISEYGYQLTDELDLLLSKSVQTGYFIESEIKAKADRKNKEIIAEKSQNLFSEAWRLYRYSFDNNQHEVVNALYENFKSSIMFIEPRSLDQTVCFFKKLDENVKAEEIIDLYIDARKEEIELFNPTGDYSFVGDIKDQTILDKFTAFYHSIITPETVEQVLERIGTQKTFNRNDETILATVSAEQYYSLLKSENGRYKHRFFLLSIYKESLNSQYASDSTKEIVNRVTKALERIALESKINEIRVKEYGIQGRRLG
ncbi:MAG: hypothetical protein CTY16_11375 [Methylobacter sp.]|nr:MAG: hypothetical protein CTY16_11375 [Methylobacter sp.]